MYPQFLLRQHLAILTKKSSCHIRQTKNSCILSTILKFWNFENVVLFWLWNIYDQYMSWFWFSFWLVVAMFWHVFDSMKNSKTDFCTKSDIFRWLFCIWRRNAALTGLWRLNRTTAIWLTIVLLTKLLLLLLLAPSFLKQYCYCFWQYCYCLYNYICQRNAALTGLWWLNRTTAIWLTESFSCKSGKPFYNNGIRDACITTDITYFLLVCFYLLLSASICFYLSVLSVSIYFYQFLSVFIYFYLFLSVLSVFICF